ncbi:MAG: 5-formyltetrahydrofolate cyclo-ligase [Mobilicoccus sp.]|nr:5-formyltetrahydrofolate cyclo-ligase [Mobilicoccus sp.]
MSGATKSEVRRTVRAARRERRAAGMSLPDEGRRIADAVLSHLDADVEARAAGWGTPGATVAAFRSTPSEPDTSVLLAELITRGVRVLVPRTRPDMSLDWHELHRAGSTAPAPTATADATAPELPGQDDVDDEGPALGLDAVADITAMILPGIAVDTAGHRLGQGGGCYDRTLPRLRPGTVQAVLLFDDEILDAVPRDAHDHRVSAVVTPLGGWRRLGAGG